MLQSFFLEDIIFPGALLFLVGFFISFYITKKLGVALCISLFKSLFFLVYFLVFFDGQYTFIDDWHYLRDAETVLRSYGFVNLFTEHLSELPDIFYSNHFVYHLYNVIAFECFGVYYFSPVALNILLTYFSGCILYLLALNIGLSPRKSIALFIFFIIHPDIVFWSSISNLKDIMVMFLTISMLYIISLYITKAIKLRHYVWLIIIIIIFSFLRFYLPYFILFSYLIYVFQKNISWKFSLKNIALIVASVIVITGVIVFVSTSSAYLVYVKLFIGDFTNPAIGILRYFLTPIPFHTDPAYGFLLLPSIFHWILLPVLGLGIATSFKINKSVSSFLLVYLLCLLLFYGSYVELQGPRHRVQLTPLIAFYQFLGLWHLLKVIIKKASGGIKPAIEE